MSSVVAVYGCGSFPLYLGQIGEICHLVVLGGEEIVV